MAVVCIQSLTIHREKFHQARPEKVPVHLKVRGCNIQHRDEKSRTWSPVLDTCVQGKSHASGRGSQAGMLSRWPTLTKRVAEPRGILVGQWVAPPSLRTGGVRGPEAASLAFPSKK